MIELELFTYPIENRFDAGALLDKVRDLGFAPYQAIIDFQYCWAIKFDTEAEAALFKLTYL